jgi:hypothetical protein
VIAVTCGKFRSLHAKRRSRGGRQTEQTAVSFEAMAGTPLAQDRFAFSIELEHEV